MGLNERYEQTQAALADVLNTSGLPLCCLRDILERLYRDACSQMKAAIKAEAGADQAGRDTEKGEKDG